MKISDFVSEYSKLSDRIKNQYIGEVIEVKEYVPLLNKVEVINRIIDTSTHAYKDGVKTNEIRVDSIVGYVFSVLSIISLYTNLTVDFSKAMDEYDALVSCGAMDEILEIIPNRELVEFNNLKEMAQSDFITNTCSPRSYIHDEVSRFSDVVKNTASPLLSPVVEKFKNIDLETISNLLSE